ncbi:hypothetical protein YC2023_092135 [Brassica napus]
MPEDSVKILLISPSIIVFSHKGHLTHSTSEVTTWTITHIYILEIKLTQQKKPIILTFP